MAMALERALELVQNTEFLETHAAKALSFAKQHGGATQRTAGAVREWWVKDSTVH